MTQSRSCVITTLRLPSTVFCLPFSVWLLTGCATSRYAGKGETDFTGRMLVAVPAAQAQRLAEAPPAARQTEDGWRFTALPGRVTARGASRAWIVADPPAGRAPSTRAGHPWDIAHRMLEGDAPGPYRDLLPALARAAGSETPALLIEPDAAGLDRPGVARAYRALTEPVPLPAANTDSKAILAMKTSPHWPRGKNMGWHQDDDFSQLRAARLWVTERAPVTNDADRIRVAVIDTGYAEQHLANPPHLNKAASRDFSADPLAPTPGAADPFNTRGFTMPGHGCGVMSILAGGRVALPGRGFDDFLGGAPDAEIVALRISDSVVHLSPYRMALAIKYAVSNGCDIISLSHGGFPSALLADAVNEAYERGTAIFAAAGDFIELPVLGYATPRLMCYPAAFSRVVGVCGATRERETYAHAPSYLTLFTFRAWWEWMLRGSYGPDNAMDEAIAAYVPNVPWALLTPNGDPRPIKENGVGTSAATPQVSAAAALWLQYHRTNDFLQAHWRGWQKVESLYWALFDAAEKNTPEGGRTYHFYGNGLLKARRALDFGVPPRLQPRRPADAAGAWANMLINLIPSMRQPPRSLVGPHAARHLDMAALELAQLTHSSLKAQELMRGWGAAAPHARVPPGELATLLDTLRKDPRASRYVRELLSGAREALTAGGAP